MKLDGALFIRPRTGFLWKHSFRKLESLNLIAAVGVMLYTALEVATQGLACWLGPSWISYTCIG